MYHTPVVLVFFFLKFLCLVLLSLTVQSKLGTATREQSSTPSLLAGTSDVEHGASSEPITRHSQRLIPRLCLYLFN